MLDVFHQLLDWKCLAAVSTREHVSIWEIDSSTLRQNFYQSFTSSAVFHCVSSASADNMVMSPVPPPLLILARASASCSTCSTQPQRPTGSGFLLQWFAATFYGFTKSCEKLILHIFMTSFVLFIRDIENKTFAILTARMRNVVINDS